MASAAQSALNYVQDARGRLVGKLKDLSLILENLKLKDILSDEAVCNIEAEKTVYDKHRKMLDSVIKKGEDTCHEFLKILYLTRDRTLAADTEVQDGFSPHSWISCFPFEEDALMDTNYLRGPRPCLQYQKKLKKKVKKNKNEFWMSNKDLFKDKKKPDLSYMPLVLNTQGSVSASKIKKLKSKKSKLSRPKKLRIYIPQDKAETSPSELLKTNRDILLVGKPGIGKTALTQEMLNLWAQGDDEKINYMFYFDMRKTSQIRKEASLEDLLFDIFCEPDEGKEEVLQDIKRNSDNVTLIFDGITDLSLSVVEKLVNRDLLPDAKIIVTCRPDDEEEIPAEDFLRVEVKGFSEQTITAYLSAVLGEEQKTVLSNVELLTLCHVPVYALMVAACFSSETPENSKHPCTITEIYINIVRLSLQRNSNTKTKHLNSFIRNKSKEILSLAEVAFHATEGKTVNLTGCPYEDSCVLSFLKPLVLRVAPTETMTTYAFLHYTMQEFFAALWLLKNPDKIKDVFQQSLTEEKRHMKHLIPFMCRLLSAESPSLMTCLIPAEELKNTSDWFFKEMITTFSLCPCETDEADTEDVGFDVDKLFLFQCLYESQCPETCVYLLDKLDYHLDLSGENLDPLPCCAVTYVVAQSTERKIQLNLKDITVSEQGIKRLFGCLKNVERCDPLLQQLWRILLLSEGQMDHLSLLGPDGNQLHLPVQGKRQLFESAVRVMQKMTTQIDVCLHWERETAVCQSLCVSLIEALPHISSLSCRATYRNPGLQHQKQFLRTLEREGKQLLLDLCLTAALHKEESFHDVVKSLLSLFPVKADLHNILLDIYQHVKSGGFSNVIPKLRPLFQSAPAVWIIDLSERKSSILLEVLKLQPEKKPVKLTGCSDEESEVRSFLQCLPHISQLSFSPWFRYSGGVKLFVNLFCAAAEREQQTGEKILQLLSSVCTYETFPLDYIYDDDNDDRKHQCDFLLDLCSHLKDYETKTGLSVLPSLQSVFQSAPAVWIIDLSERKSSILLEVLKLQPEKKPVELTGCSDEESEVRSFLQCLPHISQLSCDPEFFQSVCTVMSVRSREEAELVASLLQLLGFRLQLTGELRSKTCLSVGRALRLCGSRVNLILTPTKMSVREASLLFRHTTQLHSLSLSNDMALLLCRCVRGGRVVCPLTVEELSLSPQTAQPSQRRLLRVVSSLASLLRHWTVRQLDLTELCAPAQGLIPLLLHDGPLTVKLSEEILQQLLLLLHELQDRDLTRSSLSKIGGDLTSSCLNWELLHYLLQSSTQIITVNMRKGHFLQESITRLLPLLDRIVFKRPSPSFVMTAIRQIYEACASHFIPSLLRSLDHVINLTCREMDSADWDALLFILKHGDSVKLNLLWTSIPAEQIKFLVFTLDRVSQLSVDKDVLLKLVHYCAAYDAQQGAAVSLLRTLQHCLDLSCSSCVDLVQREPLRLSANDCRDISTILTHSCQDTRLILQDCEVEDSGLDLLFPVLDRVRLQASKAILLQLMSLIPSYSERDRVRRAVSLCRALAGELDLSHTTLPQSAFVALVLMLDGCEELVELDLSHCQLTDQLLDTLSPHLHKVQVLDLSHNNITDASTDQLIKLVSSNPFIRTVRIFSNKILDRASFKKHRQFEIW